MQEWFTSDNHFGHANVIGYCDRPFATVEAMDAELIRRWNQRVGLTDTVYILGDFALCKKPRREEIISSLNGTKILVRGNHDGDAQDCKKVFQMVCERMKVRIAKKLNVEMSHFPYECIDGRYPERHPKDQGNWILHGHVHQHWKKRGRQINVGVDVWGYAPVSKEEILAVIQNAGVEDGGFTL